MGFYGDLMKKLIVPPIVLACATVLALPSFAPASMVYFSGSAEGTVGTPSTTALQINTGGNYGGGTLTPASTANFLVGIDDVNLTLSYPGLSVQVPGFSTSNTVLYTVGLGQTVSVQTDITYDPFTILYTGNQVLALTAGLGGSFTIAAPTSMTFAALALSGHYTVTGPTQTASGNFQTGSAAQTSTGINFRWTSFDSVGYPATSTLALPAGAGLPSLRVNWGSLGSIFDVTVDGANVTASVGITSMNSMGYGNVPLVAAVPEPGSAALLGLGLLAWAGRRRRKSGS
jgi:hypothetical protein